MSKTVTLRLGDDVYDRFKRLAESDNRRLSNYIETAALRYADEHGYVDDFEVSVTENDANLTKSIQIGVEDARARRGRFV